MIQKAPYGLQLTDTQKAYIDLHRKQSPRAIAEYLSIAENRIIKYRKLQQLIQQ